MIAASQHDTLGIIKRLALLNSPQLRLLYHGLVRYTKKQACVSGVSLLRGIADYQDPQQVCDTAERVALGEDTWKLSVAGALTTVLVSLLLRYLNMLTDMYGELGIPALVLQELALSGVHVTALGASDESD